MSVEYETFRDGGLKYLLLKLSAKLTSLLADKIDNGQLATELVPGLIKLNPNESVTLNTDGQLVVGGRLGQMPTGTGLFAPNDREPTAVADYSFLITEAKGYAFNSSKSMGVLTGAGITCRSAAANSTQYRVQNTYNNRIICKALEGGLLALNETEAKEGNLAKVLSVQINGADFMPDSSPNNTSTANDIVITVDKTINPNGATTSIRGYAIGTGGYSNIVVGQLASQGGNGASAIIGSQVRNGANFSLVVGTQLYSDQSASAVLGRNHINRKQNAFLAGQGHDTSSGSNGVAAVGVYSDIKSDTAFAVGAGTSHIARKNLFEVKTNGDVYINGTKLNIP